MRKVNQQNRDKKNSHQNEARTNILLLQNQLQKPNEENRIRENGAGK